MFGFRDIILHYVSDVINSGTCVFFITKPLRFIYAWVSHSEELCRLGIIMCHVGYMTASPQFDVFARQIPQALDCVEIWRIGGQVNISNPLSELFCH